MGREPCSAKAQQAAILRPAGGDRRGGPGTRRGARLRARDHRNRRGRPDPAARPHRTIRAAIDGRDDADRCARIAIRLERAAIVVTVVLPDGRAASRSVSRGDDVVPTLEALLLLPRPDARAPDAAPAGPAAPVRAAAPVRTSATARATARTDAAPRTAATDTVIVAARTDATATPAVPDADDRLRLGSPSRPAHASATGRPASAPGHSGSSTSRAGAFGSRAR